MKKKKIFNRFTVNALAVEAGLDWAVVGRLLAGSVPCGYQETLPLFTFRDLINALLREHEQSPETSGDLEAEQTRLTRARASLAEAELAVRKGQLITTEGASRLIVNVCHTIKRTILTSPLSHREQDSICAELRVALRGLQKEYEEASALEKAS